ncbi:MAG: GTPase Era [Erysipelotrichaceae bacterium]|jgi:GTP-binding protein Era|nr:GTPase Era [Erysipelotrichaceae bacterium]
MKSGFVSLLGRPNAGKSTLLNAIMKQEVSIVTKKPQTTRNLIRAIYEDEEAQIVFVDTPGVHKPFNQFSTFMNKIAYKSATQSEVTLLIIDASSPFGGGDEFLISRINPHMNVIVVFTKIDLVYLKDIEKLKAKYHELLPDCPQVEVRAPVGFNIDELLRLIKTRLQFDDRLYDDATLISPTMNFVISEIIREQIIILFGEEIPYAVAIEVKNLAKKSTGYLTDATIFVQKESQKPIIIGKNGLMIKKIGTRARKRLETLYHEHFVLNLNVVTKKDWQQNAADLKRFGYTS